MCRVSFVDKCAVRFVPRESGVHWVHVQDNSLSIAGSPFRCVVGPHVCDATLVTAHGQALAAGYTGNLDVYLDMMMMMSSHWVARWVVQWLGCSYGFGSLPQQPGYF